MNNNVTVRQTSDHETVYLFFVNGVQELTVKGLQQKGYYSYQEAYAEGIKKAKQISKK